MSQLLPVVSIRWLLSLDPFLQVTEVTALQTLLMPSVVILVQDKIAPEFWATL
jgi:hypothetical protein